MQMLVLSTIEHYESAQKLAHARGTTVAALTKKKTKEPCVGNHTFVLTDGDKPVGKGRALYSQWPKKWLTELLVYSTDSDATAFDKYDKNRLLEIVEFAFDVRCVGKDLDKVSNVKVTKKDQYSKLKIAYEKKGCRLENIENMSGDGYIKWEDFGCYKLTSGAGADGKGLTLKCMSLNKSVAAGDDVLNGDEGPFSLTNNFSLVSAAVKSPNDVYTCQNFFPQMSRMLKRSVSEVVAAASGARTPNLEMTPPPERHTAASPGSVSAARSSRSAIPQAEDISRKMPSQLKEDGPQMGI